MYKKVYLNIYVPFLIFIVYFNNHFYQMNFFIDEFIKKNYGIEIIYIFILLIIYIFYNKINIYYKILYIN